MSDAHARFGKRPANLPPQVLAEVAKQAGVVAIVGTADGKAAIAVAVAADLTGRFNAAELAKAAVIAMGGQGAGGKPDFAQGGAPDDSKAADGVAAVRAALG